MMSSLSKSVNLYSGYLVAGPKVPVLSLDFQTVPQDVGTLQIRATNNGRGGERRVLSV